mmetsp:Transcript_44965/g.98241  ORF Transcript_44965/g.98241 Transcript_44965/m.98241 type:complete len:167 (+) Transcript_44965:724-1224(+)
MYEAMLEDVSNILNNGEVPNLFDRTKIKIPDTLPQMKAEIKKDEIIGKMQEKLKAKGVRGQLDNAVIWKMFIENVKQHLHIMLVQSPSGEEFRFRMRSFPNLINCATINWFHAWPSDALIETATSVLQPVAIDDQFKKKIIKICCNFHESVKALSIRFKEEEKRHF